MYIYPLIFPFTFPIYSSFLALMALGADFCCIKNCLSTTLRISSSKLK